MLAALLLCGQPLAAQREHAPDENWGAMAYPPAGFARPPYHLHGDATTGPSGMAPAMVRHAYGFDLLANQGAGQTIAIIDAYDDPNIASDLNTFDAQFGLPACTTSNGCFTKFYATGEQPLASASWALEISLDVEWAHAIAPKATIILVEAASSSTANLMAAVDVAVQHGASVVNMSWGGPEFSTQTNDDLHFAHNGVTFVASSGDSGHGVEYPASSPDVISVGGTSLYTDSYGNYLLELAWSESGGGLSTVAHEPLYQAKYPIPNDASAKRGTPDVAYDSDPNTGFAIYDSVPLSGQSGWMQVGGTSAGAPQWAALFAIVNSLRTSAGMTALTGAATTIYAMSSANFHDVITGTNGTCGTLCTSAPRYDYVTGLGSPVAVSVVSALVGKTSAFGLSPFKPQ